MTTTAVLTLNTGVQLPPIGLGVFQTPPDETRDAVSAALSTGYRHIDTAAAYGNEKQVGEALAGSGIARDEVFVETKIWISDYGYDETLHGFDKSAAKLGSTHNFMADHLTTLLKTATVVPAVNQIEVHPYFQQREVQAFGAEHGILTQAWSPIGGIFYREGEHTSTLEDPAIVRIAEAHSKSPAQVMLRWHLQQGRSVIPKSTKPTVSPKTSTSSTSSSMPTSCRRSTPWKPASAVAPSPRPSPWRPMACRFLRPADISGTEYGAAARSALGWSWCGAAWRSRGVASRRATAVRRLRTATKPGSLTPFTQPMPHILAFAA
jgi:diketogulonate reductase-like aldo/keto reductase